MVPSRNQLSLPVRLRSSIRCETLNRLDVWNSCREILFQDTSRLDESCEGISPKGETSGNKIFGLVAVMFIPGGHFRRSILTSKAPERVLENNYLPSQKY